MAQPEGVSVAFGQAALTADPDWTRIDADQTLLLVTGWQTKRGRTYILDKTDTGTASVDFYDFAGTMDPTNADGPFFPMDPNCPFAIALYNPVTETWKTIYTGLEQNVELTLDLTESFLTGTLSAADLFSLLAIAEIPPGVDFAAADDGSNSPNGIGDTTYAQQSVNDRLLTILADADITDPAFIDFFTGNVQVQACVEPPGTKVLQALQDTADAEFPGVANLYVSTDGKITFRGRLARFNPSDYDPHTWQCGDTAAVAAGGSGWVLINGLTYDRDVEKVINAASFSPQGIADDAIAAQLDADGTSITQFGPRTLSGSDLLTAGGEGSDTNDANDETFLYAEYYVENCKLAQNRVSQITFRWLPPEDPRAGDLWNLLCNVEIGDIVEITTTHPGAGGFLAEPYFVEGISYDAKPLGREDIPDMVDITLTLDLSPKAYFTSNPFPSE